LKANAGAFGNKRRASGTNYNSVRRAARQRGSAGKHSTAATTARPPTATTAAARDDEVFNFNGAALAAGLRTHQSVVHRHELLSSNSAKCAMTKT
jgi:hypothetical protein